MKKLSLLFCLVFTLFCLISCQPKERDKVNIVDENIAFAADQYGLLLESIENSEKLLNPKSIINGKMKYIPPQEWTSGFFPGSLWYLYALTGDESWKSVAIKYTEMLDTIQYFTGNHDIGFMIGCSYGNGLRFAGKNDYKEVIIQAAKSLCTRYNP
ncbi:MAG: glucuronyl hydrolase, partial [Bacteroidales bacterium]|nr:glucuronyl hydrolase [Bacteroidales bacterium]